MSKQVIDVTEHDNLLVQCKEGRHGDDAIEAAKQFCKFFKVKCVIVHHNANFIQVTTQGDARKPTAFEPI